MPVDRQLAIESLKRLDNGLYGATKLLLVELKVRVDEGKKRRRNKKICEPG